VKHNEDKEGGGQKGNKVIGSQDWGHRIISQNLFTVLKPRYEGKF
jgi:hypothetical protein